ncbi:MAG: class I SAM-dependent methyltransferase [Opitutaceae bacterium]
MPAPDYKSIWNQLAQTEASALMHVAGYTDESRLAWATGITEKMLEITIGLGSADTVLEIGCGVGRVGKVVAPRVARWIGCDVSESMLAHARRRLAGLPNVELMPTNGYDLRPVPDGTVDAVYCTVVFMHLDEWDRYGYVREAYRVLRPGGRFMCDNANLESDEGWTLFLASAAVPPAERPGHLSRCSTVPEISCYLKKAGFRETQTITPGVWVVGWGVK